MAHEEQSNFCKRVQQHFPSHFVQKRVLDCGSLEINGTNRSLFFDCKYIGIDLAKGSGVDEVSPIHAFAGEFDTIICTEVFEHDPYWKESLQNIYSMLVSGGLFLFTCATTGRKEHGTRKSKPRTSPFTSQIEGWKHYYRNLTEDDIREALPIADCFQVFEFSTNVKSCDLYFWGVKK